MEPISKRWIPYVGPHGGMGEPSAGYDGHYEYEVVRFDVAADGGIIERERSWMSGMSQPFNVVFYNGGIWGWSSVDIGEAMKTQEWGQKMGYALTRKRLWDNPIAD